MANNSIWQQPGLNQNQFVALTNLLSLRNNGQVEPTSIYEEPGLDEKAHDGDDAESVDTSFAQQLFSSGNDTLKRQFLDDIAEFAAKEHGARFVACTAMREREDDVTILIARNTAFEACDFEFFDGFSDLVSRWSKHLNAPPVAEKRSWVQNWMTYFWDVLSPTKNVSTPISNEDAVWDEILKYHATRITSAYIPQLRRNFRECPMILVRSDDIDGKGSLARIENLRRVVFSISDADLSHVDNLSRPLGLEKALELLGLNMTATTVHTLLGPNWTIKGAKKRFAEIGGQQGHIHAEVQMLLHLCSAGFLHSAPYEYIGCSKRSCFMCWTLLRSHGRYSTRGCHGRLYSRWTVPEIADFATDQTKALGTALIKTQDSLVRKLGDDFENLGRLQKTSVVGGSSVISESLSTNESRSSELSQRDDALTQQRVQLSFERLEREQANSALSNATNLLWGAAGRASADLMYHPDWRDRLSGGPRGGTATYLDTLSRALTPGDYLYQDCMDDRMPDDPDVLQKFGFGNLPSYHDRTKLLGLYIGLTKYLRVTAEQLNIWQEERSLTANIIREYTEQTSFTGGAYFPWFLENTHILDDPQESNHIEGAMKFIKIAQTFLEPNDQKRNWRELEPGAKQYSFEILWMALMGARPRPEQETWMKFGFCACRNDSEENILGSIYTSLLTDQQPGCLVPEHLRAKPCTFTEFWCAYESGRLVPLMEDRIRNGFADIKRLPLVRDYLSRPPSVMNPSVWDLKQFLEINKYTKYPPVESVKVDYGFLNCRGFEETCTLAEIYKRLLRIANPLELHEACLKNRLFELAKKYHRMDEGHRRLMNNKYSREVMLGHLAQRKFFVEDGGKSREVSFAEFHLQCKASARRAVITRIQPSSPSQDDNRLDRIEEQLSAIQQTLGTLQDQLAGFITSQNVLKVQTESVLRAVSDKDGDTNTLGGVAVSTNEKRKAATAYEGESALSVQSRYANRIFKEVLERSPRENSQLAVDADVSQLDNALNRDNPTSAFHENPFPTRIVQNSTLARIELPPLDAVVSLLKWAKGPVSPTLLSFLPLVTASDLAELCKKAYFAIEECSTSELIIINSCLVFLIPEFLITSPADGSTNEAYGRHASLCHRNIEILLASLNLFMALTLENSKALVLGSVYAVGVSSLSMAWTLISTAARLCQSLGYHRLVAAKESSTDDFNVKKAIFGYVYILDKTLSLRLGRPSSIPDVDLAVDPIVAISMTEPQPWNFIWCLWIEAATIHGRTFEQLYSPQAMGMSHQARLEAVQRLSNATIAAKEKNAKFGQQFANTDNFRNQHLKFVKQANDVVYFSLLTLIHRAIPNNEPGISSPFNHECLAAARAALAAHHLCFTNYKDQHKYIWTIYLQWTILACPFIPFLVIFCHAVTTLSLDTINDLELFVTSLLPPSRTHTTSQKMHDLCQKFYQVGKSYIEDQLSTRQNKIQPDNPFRQGQTAGFNAFNLMPELRQTSELNFESGNFFEQNLGIDDGAWSFGDPHILGILDDGLELNDRSWPNF
ncbi:hypothetical protein GLAREA_12844 [Glarea lozoyensis ATCC 20868]|uniref:Xylanolytic transcriptional activator regulatory domain-containing protein n=1 Tax=Glarea lozoyensis (strain ATCC 20868 / MF5171) TaxID=1116229 RepID=S3DDQ5_GLAL2|nr:uncharacterized protein GLAREA_12844 [Glarea lozoyensis ATCC 20868]EPE30121.1 hypothetical protein GLAREA_12844 [Glarea lozoyensis ATCC 20868]